MKDVSNKYISCPDCDVPMPNGMVEKNIKYGESGLFNFKIKSLGGTIDWQCPKCFKVWEEKYQEDYK